MNALVPHVTVLVVLKAGVWRVIRTVVDQIASYCDDYLKLLLILTNRNKSRRALSYQEVLDKLAEKGIAIRVASPKLVMEEAPESYKDVTQVGFRW